jgi:cellulose synthase/poly-beta-1,6-N-acetylglucosamine synthase-like glycosyltransferase
LATGDVIAFVDADVVVHPEALPGMYALLSETPDLGAVFGAYDVHPPVPTFISQFKNLSHTYVHEVGSPEANTFWAGLGAVRTDAFRAVHGFDERFARPSVEDIDLGYRLRQAGYRIRLDPRFRATHLKAWTWGNVVRTDIRARGIPWTQMILRFKALANDLNTSTALRLSVVSSYLTVLFLLLALVNPWAIAGAAAAFGILLALNRDFYRWLHTMRGPTFALRATMAHLLHHLCNGVSFVTGTFLYAASQFGLRLPGALPSTPWLRGMDDGGSRG